MHKAKTLPASSGRTPGPGAPGSSASSRSGAPAADAAPDAPPAPLWHTAALVALIVGVAVLGTLLGRHVPGAGASPVRQRTILSAYLPLVAVEWALVFYVCRVGRLRSALATLLGRGWDSARRGGVDIALAAAGWLIAGAGEACPGRLASARNDAVVAMAPHSGAEHVAWVIVAASAGFCEEVVYRGYLQTQFAALFRWQGVAIGLQALLFGVAHAEQGAAGALRAVLYGAALGALARWRRSLVPGIVFHIGLDLAGGL